MWTEALPINWMDSLAVLFIAMMAIAGGVGLWRRWTGASSRESETDDPLRRAA